MQIQSIKSVRKLGIKKTLDFKVNHADHNFYAEGIVVSNSHGISYSYLAALTVYLKFKYPKEFFLENIRCYGKEDIPSIERELPYFDIKLLRPDIIKSHDDFTIEGKDIRFGLSGVKSLNDASLLKIHDFLNKETTSKFSVLSAAKQAKVSILVLANIIHAGALNSLGDDRPKLVLEAQIWNCLSDKEKAYCLQNGARYSFNLIEMLKHYPEWIDSSGKKFKESRLQTLRRDVADYFKQYDKNRTSSKLSAYLHEKKLLGYSYSTTIKDIFVKDNPKLLNCREVKDLIEKSPVQIVAEVKEIKKGMTKTGKPYMKLFLVDETSETQSMILGDKLERYTNKFKDPEEGDLVYVIGSKGADIIWVNSQEIQTLDS